MEEYKLVCIVLFTLMTGSNAWPQKADTDNRQSRVSTRKDTTTGHLGTLDDDDGITFPGDDLGHGRKDFTAAGKGLNCTDDVCENAADYPYDHIQKAVSRLPNLASIFGKTVGNYVNTSSRVGPESNDPKWQHLCESNVQTSYPKTLKNEEKVEKFIVNVGEFKQGVTIEKCISDKCVKDVSFPVGFEAKCEQRYSSVRLLAVEPDSKGTPAYDTFITPSCCVCVFTKPKS